MFHTLNLIRYGFGAKKKKRRFGEEKKRGHGVEGGRSF